MSAGHSRRDVLGYALRGVACTGLACSGFACTGLGTPVAEAAATTLPLLYPWDATDGQFIDGDPTFCNLLESEYQRWVQSKSEEFS
jgi:hypothetical protein